MTSDSGEATLTEKKNPADYAFYSVRIVSSDLRFYFTYLPPLLDTIFAQLNPKVQVTARIGNSGKTKNPP
ncbi:hypothetical protein EK904_006449 [Melospiza melodia maxima]|nr:hypothetical protein EK904_006449 [Melospiza melodia maxima]